MTFYFFYVKSLLFISIIPMSEAWLHQFRAKHCDTCRKDFPDSICHYKELTELARIEELLLFNTWLIELKEKQICNTELFDGVLLSEDELATLERTKSELAKLDVPQILQTISSHPMCGHCNLQAPCIEDCYSKDVEASKDV